MRHEDNNLFTGRTEKKTDNQSNKINPSTPIINRKLDFDEKDNPMSNNEINMYVLLKEYSMR